MAQLMVWLMIIFVQLTSILMNFLASVLAFEQTVVQIHFTNIRSCCGRFPRRGAVIAAAMQRMIDACMDIADFNCKARLTSLAYWVKACPDPFSPIPRVVPVRGSIRHHPVVSFPFTGIGFGGIMTTYPSARSCAMQERASGGICIFCNAGSLLI